MRIPSFKFSIIITVNLRYIILFSNELMEFEVKPTDRKLNNHALKWMVNLGILLKVSSSKCTIEARTPFSR